MPSRRSEWFSAIHRECPQRYIPEVANRGAGTLDIPCRTLSVRMARGSPSARKRRSKTGRAVTVCVQRRP